MSIYEDFHKRRNSGNSKISELKNLDVNRFFALDTRCYSDGAISARDKELLGLVASLVLRCNDCILYHLENTVKMGFSREQIVEALNVGLVVSGSIIIPHLRFAMEALNELFELNSQNNL